MPARNFCDLCDIQIDKSVSMYSIALNVSKDTEPYSSAGYHELYHNGLKKIYIPVEISMVCPKCIGKIRLLIERLKEDAIQERKTKAVSMDEEAASSERVRAQGSSKETVEEDIGW